MPQNFDLNVFKSLSSEDFADIGVATQTDPTLLQPPPLTRRDKWAHGLNEATKALAIIFQDKMGMQAAQQREQEMDQERQSAMLGKLMPAMAAGRLQRAEQARTDALDKQREVMSLRRERLAEQATKSLVHVDPKTGRTRGLHPEEVEQMVNHQLQTLDNPQMAGPPFIPDNVRRLSPEEEEAGKTRVRKEEDLKSDMDPRRIKLDADKASRNSYAAALAGVLARTSPQAREGLKKLAQDRSDILETRHSREVERKASSGDPAAKELKAYVERGTQSTGLGPIKPSIEKQIRHLAEEAKKFATEPDGLQKNKARLESIAELIEDLQGVGKAELAPVSFGGGDE